MCVSMPIFGYDKCEVGTFFNQEEDVGMFACVSHLRNAL